MFSSPALFPSRRAYQGARSGKGDLKFFGSAKNFTDPLGPNRPPALRCDSMMFGGCPKGVACGFNALRGVEQRVGGPAAIASALSSS